MISAQVISFIQSNLLRDRTASIGPHDSLIELGLLDSMGLMRILQFLEAQTGVRIPGHYVTPEHFRSAAAIAEMIEQIRGEPAVAGDGA
jgi:acyl carrier protein